MKFIDNKWFFILFPLISLLLLGVIIPKTMGLICGILYYITIIVTTILLWAIAGIIRDDNTNNRSAKIEYYIGFMVFVFTSVFFVWKGYNLYPTQEKVVITDSNIVDFPRFLARGKQKAIGSEKQEMTLWSTYRDYEIKGTVKIQLFRRVENADYLTKTKKINTDPILDSLVANFSRQEKQCNCYKGWRHEVNRSIHTYGVATFTGKWKPSE